MGFGFKEASKACWKWFSKDDEEEADGVAMAWYWVWDFEKEEQKEDESIWDIVQVLLWKTQCEFFCERE